MSVTSICFGLIAFMKGFGMASGDYVYRVAFLMTIPLIGARMMSQKYTETELLSLCIILFSGMMNYILTGQTIVLFSAIFLSCVKRLDFHRIAVATLKGRILGICAALAFLLTGIRDDVLSYQWRDDVYNVILRHSLGFDHPNVAHETFTIIVIILAYVYYNRMNLFLVAIIAMLNHLLFSFTLSRTGYLMVLITLALSLIIKSGKFQRIFRFGFYCFYPTVLVASFLTAYFYTPGGVLGTLDRLLTGRLLLAHMAMMNYVPAIFGNAQNVGITLDNGYIRLLYEGGLIPFMWFVYYTMKLNAFLYRADKQKEQFLFFLMNIYAITEGFWIAPSVNLSILLIGQVLFCEHKRAEVWKIISTPPL